VVLWVGLGAPVVLPAVESVKGISVDNFWHNDLFARIGSTCGGGEWRYLVDLHVNLASHHIHVREEAALARWRVGLGSDAG